jgi:predicted DNA-binding transcriptional regulator AlpA
MTKQSEFKPRLWSVRETASYWGVSRTTFKKLVRQGTAPGPVNAGLGCHLFDSEQQARAIDALSGATAVGSETDLDRELDEFIRAQG